MQVTVAEAAATLGISEDAVRKRLKRGALKCEKRGRRVFVLMDPTASKTVQDKAGPASNNESNGLAAVIEAKNEEIARLVGLLERTSDEKDRLFQVVEREQVLRQQQQGQIDQLQARLGAPRPSLWQRLLGKGPTTVLVLAAMVSVMSLTLVLIPSTAFAGENSLEERSGIWKILCSIDSITDLETCSVQSDPDKGNTKTGFIAFVLFVGPSGPFVLALTDHPDYAGLRVDNRAGFEFYDCKPNYCIFHRPELYTDMKEGKTILVVLSNREGRIEKRISLEGFSEMVRLAEQRLGLSPGQ